MTKMHDYFVEMRRTSYISVAVTAKDKDAAEAQAWKAIDDGRWCEDIGNTDWVIDSIERGDEYKGEE